MLVSFNPNISNNNYNKKQNPTFGSFPVPKTLREVSDLRDKVTFKELLPTKDNIESLKIAHKQTEKVVRAYIENIAEKWGFNPEELFR